MTATAFYGSFRACGRYQNAIGKSEDQWEGVQTITAKRENPHGFFRMHNPHIVELYEKVQIGANVYVVP